MNLSYIEFLCTHSQKLRCIPRTYKTYAFYKKQVKELKQLRVQPISLREVMDTIIQSSHVWVLQEILRYFDESILYKSKVHGVLHNVRVCLLAFYMCCKLQLPEEDIRLAIYAAMYHDIGRINDCEDATHGARSAKKLDELKLPITEEELHMLKVAITFHSLDDQEFTTYASEHSVQQRLQTLYAILKDADALDRVRLGYPYVRLPMLRLHFSKLLVPASYQLEYNLQSLEVKWEQAMCEKSLLPKIKGTYKHIVKQAIHCFFQNENKHIRLSPHTYHIGDDVMLTPHHYLHGTRNNASAIDFIACNGIMAKEVGAEITNHSVRYVSGFWRVFQPISLAQYIQNYSGMDVTYEKTEEVVPYGKLDAWVEKCVMFRIGNGRRKVQWKLGLCQV